MKKSETVLKIYNSSTYPAALKKLFQENRSLFAIYECDPTDENTLKSFTDWWEENSKKGPYLEFIDQFVQAIKNIWIEGFHITRTLPNPKFLQKYYLERGLLRPDAVYTPEYFEEMLNCVGYGKDTVNAFVTSFYAVLHNDDRDMCVRRKTISIFTAPSYYVLNILQGGYKNIYGINTFGEIGREVHKELIGLFDSIFESIKKITCPHMIRIRFQLTDVAEDSCEYPMEFVISQLIGIMGSKYFKNSPEDLYLIHANNSVFCAQLKKDVPSDNILDVLNRVY